MHSTLLSLAVCASLAAAGGRACADERWTHVGDLQFNKPWLTGKLAIDLSSLRKRAQHYEIWERVAIDADPARPLAAFSEDDPKERLVLWALHCRRGSMAVITEGIPGSFEPRAERLKFYVPAPNSAGAAVLETACAEVHRLTAGSAPPQVQDAAHAAAVVKSRLDQPPVTFDEEDQEEE